MTIDYSRYFWKNRLITLRQPKEEDWQALVHHMFDTPGRFFFNEEVDMPTDLEQYKQRHIDALEPGKLDYTCFAIENSDGKHVGIANLFSVDERNGKFGPIGIVVNPSDRGKGYALAAYRMLGNYMFNERRMHKWNSGYTAGNTASEILHQKAGFIVEGIQRDVTFHEGRYWSMVLCGVTEKEFNENEAKLPKL
jgi:RimJ/RimL family protein N-acetyltransferase